LREFTMDANVMRSFRVRDADFTRERKLPFWNVAALILRGWKMSIQNRINKFFDTLGVLDDNGSIPTASAFCQAREKMKPEFFKALNEKTVQFFYDHEAGELVKKWKGRYLLWAVDCSQINIPDTEETREKYGVHVNQYGVETVQAQVSFLYDLLNEATINSCMGATTRSEKSFIFDEHARYYREDVLAIYDRLHADYSVVAFHAKKGVDFLIRCPTITFGEIEEFAKSSKLADKVVTLRVTERQRKFVEENGLPTEVTVRLVKVRLEDGKIEVLMTSLLDREKYRLKDFKWLYGKRWGVETYIDRLKNQLEVERFSSKKLIGIEQDFYAVVFMSTLESALEKEDEEEVVEESRRKHLKYEYRINKSVSYSALVDHVMDLLVNLDKSPEEVSDELSRLFKSGRTPIRPGRKFERKDLTPRQKLRFHKYKKRIWA
jgi:hypothetical protein